MVLTTHAVVGGALASIAHAEPVAAFSIGFLSHFILDSIPHWDYFHLLGSFKTKGEEAGFTVEYSRRLMYDIGFIILDIVLGFILVFLFFLRKGFVLDLGILVKDPIIWGAIGSILPDFLQLVYSKFPYQPFRGIQKFSEYIHSKNYSFQNKFLIGATLQVIIVAVFVILTIIF
jgi:hypothetical protein